MNRTTKINKILASIFIILMLVGTANATPSTTSVVQESNTNNIYMKLSDIWSPYYDVYGYYDQLNYWTLPVTIELVNGTNYPYKYKTVNVYLYDLTTRRYIYSRSLTTDSQGKATAFLSHQYTGRSYNQMRLQILFSNTDGKYNYYKRYFDIYWYISTRPATAISSDIDPLKWLEQKEVENEKEFKGKLEHT